MAWYDNLLQRGTNYFTGNNLTNMDPNVQNAMAQDALGTNNQLQDESFSDRRYEDTGGVHPPRRHSGLQSTMPHDIGNWREDVDINYLDKYPRPHQTNMADVSGRVGEYGVKPGEGIMGTDQAQDKTNFLQKIMDNTMFGKIAAMNNPLNPNAANFNPRLEGQVEDLRNINFLGDRSEGYQIRGGPLAGQNLVSGFGTNDYDQMLAKKAAWFQKRKDAEKGFSQENWNKVIAEQDARALENNARDGVADRANIEKIERYTGRPVSDYRMSRPASERQFTGHGTSGMGRDRSDRMAYGGRAGYQGGELVEQQTDFIEGPQGGEEFQETVVEGQEQPSREQLEALAMEIFQLPLEELDEPQLVVVYQTAMQGQPMQESVQEEDVQFVAQGGLAGLL